MVPVSGKSNDGDPELAGVQWQLQRVSIFRGTLHLFKKIEESHFLASTFFDLAIRKLEPTFFIGDVMPQSIPALLLQMLLCVKMRYKTIFFFSPVHPSVLPTDKCHLPSQEYLSLTKACFLRETASTSCSHNPQHVSDRYLSTLHHSKALADPQGRHDFPRPIKLYLKHSHRHHPSYIASSLHIVLHWVILHTHI